MVIELRVCGGNGLVDGFWETASLRGRHVMRARHREGRSWIGMDLRRCEELTFRKMQARFKLVPFLPSSAKVAIRYRDLSSNHVIDS